MNYIFHVREWNVDFYIHLEKRIKNKKQKGNIVWLTMMKSVYTKLIKINKKAYYLPDLFEIFSSRSDNENENYHKLDRFIYDKYNYGIQFLYEIERFKPVPKHSLKFIHGHVNALMDIMPDNAKMISLSCDHFVYILSGYINEYKGGENYFIQPIGFPLNAQVIMQNLWDINCIRKEQLDTTYLEEYIESLCLDPKVSIHYMKPQKNISLKHSFLKRIEDLTSNRVSENIFTYLEPISRNIIPGRFKEKNKIDYNFDYLLEPDINNLEDNCKIFYYPLQFEPEMSILGYSPWYKDQLEVIRLLSQSLKYGDVLLLKENPKMIGKRKRDFYDFISKFINVKWAHPDINSRLIIRKSHKVISITGTATIEAACMGVNSLIFGHPPFRDLLIEKPIADVPLCSFIETLYRNYDSDIIIKHLENNWGEFSKSLFFGNFIPTYIENKLTLKDNQLLAKSFFEEVLER